MNITNDSSGAAPRQQNIKVTTPHGTLYIDGLLAAEDHAHMRSVEIQALFTLASGEGQDSFAGMNAELQNSLLWMASRAAGELKELLSQVSFAAARVAK